ncbi:hypothetical protein H2200_010427 [Cladophialophora chaetospira]|uniref:Uncharacterized protein n=1 Tax=Cladophialophora chaetospira TaxID=386627 RepID=A0AA38X1I1_9EURO|nr:hypothetical protein H2200_010427 [Cladophialophora chaetospira]
MTKAADPYYNRKPVPDELIKDVGLTGLTPQDEFLNREKKYTLGNGVDVRRFSNGLNDGSAPQNDPYYGRRKVSDQEIHGVAETGLTAEDEYLNRERKYSVQGQDVRKFSRGTKNSLAPSTDPYYNRKKVTDAETQGIAPLDHLTPAEQYEARERKQSLFQLSSDPFDNLRGSHRQSISGAVTGASAAATRRRSSAVAPDGVAAAQGGRHHSGFDGNKLEPIVSRADGPSGGSHNGESSASGHVSEDTLNRDSIDPVGYNGHSGGGHDGGHTRVYDAVTSGHHHDPDSVAPHEHR